MSEWLDIMLDEIARKSEEAGEDTAEAERRVAESQHPAENETPADPPGRG